MTRLEQIKYLNEVKKNLILRKEKQEEFEKGQKKVNEKVKVKVLRYKPKKRS